MKYFYFIRNFTNCISFRGEGIKGEISNSIFLDRGPPPSPPEPPGNKLNHQQLCPPTPSVYLENKKQAFSPQLQEFCLKHPIAVVRGLASALKLGKFFNCTSYVLSTRVLLPYKFHNWSCD